MCGNRGYPTLKATGSSTSAFASASGLSRTMAMSISPPSFWIRAGRPACICARIATATGCVPILLRLFALECQSVVGHFVQKVRNLRNPWVSVQDVVLNSLEPSTLPSQPLPELSHFYQTHKQQGVLLMSLWFLLVCHALTQNDAESPKQQGVLLMSLWFLLVCHALTQNDAESPVSIFLLTSQKRSKTHVLTKSLYIKTWFVCLNKFECLKNVETFQAPKHGS